MTRFLFSLLLLTSYFSSFAQKVDLDKFKFSTTAIELPINYVAPEYRTFDIRIAMSDEMNGFAQSKYDNLYIDGYTYTPENPTVMVYGNINRVTMTSSSIKTRVSEDKDKDGKVKSTKTYYYVEARYAGLGEYKINGPINPYMDLKELDRISKKKEKESKKDKEKSDNPFLTNQSQTSVGANNMMMESRTYNMKKEYVYTGRECNSYDEASKNWRNDAERELYNKKQQYVNDFFGELSATLARQYGYRPIKDWYHLWILDSKSHPEYETQQKAIEAVKILLPKLNGNTDMVSFKNELAPVLEYFKTLPVKYTTTDKADKKMRYSAYYNLAKLNYIIDDTKASKEYADLLIKNDFDKEDGEMFIELSNELENKFKFFKTDTRQAVK